MTSEYVKGAEMAYNDCAELINNMASNLPPELSFAKEGFSIIAGGIRSKIEHMKVLAGEATEQ